jgi:hypothetical protein
MRRISELETKIPPIVHLGDKTWDLAKRLEDTCESKKKVSSLEVRLDTFASIEHINKIQEILLPRVEAFSMKIDEFLHDNNQIREVVRKFDEDISIKANKTEY